MDTIIIFCNVGETNKISNALLKHFSFIDNFSKKAYVLFIMTDKD